MLYLDLDSAIPYNALLFAEVVELVDTSVSKTDGLCPCRFDSGLRYHKEKRELANLVDSLSLFIEKLQVLFALVVTLSKR